MHFADHSAEKDLVIFARSFRLSSAFQSLASLIYAWDQSGRTVHLITQSEPSGDDFVACDRMRRYSIDVYENRGYSTEEAFFKIISEIPCNTVLFAGDIYAKTLQFFQTAQRLGRCILFDTDRSPLYYISSGSEKLSMTCMYMIRYADCVISHTRTDAQLIEGMGARKSRYIPYYFPYTQQEIGEAQFTGGRFVYYTTYAGRNTRAAVSAFTSVHMEYPDTHLTIVPVNVRKSPVLEELVRDIQTSQISSFVSIETDVLKPLRFLREADVSLTYAHLVSMPETVMESMSLGIPTIDLQDASYDEEDEPYIRISAWDEDRIAEQMLRFMLPQECEKYRVSARALLSDGYRAQLLCRWEELINSVQKAYLSDLSQCRDTLESLCAYRRSLNTLPTVVNRLRSKGVCADAVFGCLLACGVPFPDILDAFRASICGQKDVQRMLIRSDVFSRYIATDYEQYRNLKIIPVDIAALLSVCGLDCAQISSFFSNLYFTESQIAKVLLHVLPIELCLRDFRPEGTSALCTTAMQAFRSYNLENARYYRVKAIPGFQRAMKYYDWKSAPYAQHGVVGKVLLLPNRILDRFKKAVQMKGRQRLLKRKVVEVDPGDVRKIQLMVLNLMLEFERICKKHGLRYYLAGGTILGGIRHKGFIPWDDDMDITMPRPDYDKFLKIAQKELPPDMKLDKDCVPFCHNRIEYRDTRFDTMWRNGGIFLDILALDGSPDDERQRLKHEHKTKFWRFWMLERVRPIPPMSASRDVQMIILKRVIARLMPRWFLKWRWHSWAARYDCRKTSSWVCLPASIYTYEQERFPKEYWGEPVMMEFEGYDMPTMQHWEDYLICHFGNYMKMPPYTLRKSHHFIYHYDLGKYKDISTQELERRLIGPKKKEVESR